MSYKSSVSLEKSTGENAALPLVTELASLSPTLTPRSPPTSRARGSSVVDEPKRTPKVTRSLTISAADAYARARNEAEERRREEERRGRPALPSSKGPGLFSRLFSPDATRKAEPRTRHSKSPTVNPDRIHSESKKETNMLGSTFRRFKLKREEHR
ncbi:toxin-antitoxin system, toxin component, PIN domain protein, partial [Oesophagostomum dentatum]